MSQLPAPKTTAPAQSREEMIAEILRLKAEIAAQPRGLSMKVTEKGGVSVYGLGRFPVTLYKSQWDSLLANAENIKAFVEANKGKLASKAV